MIIVDVIAITGEAVQQLAIMPTPKRVMHKMCIQRVPLPGHAAPCKASHGSARTMPMWM